MLIGMIGLGIMAAYAEGLNLLHHANVGKQSQQASAELTPLRHPEHYQYDLNIAVIFSITKIYLRARAKKTETILAAQMELA